MGSLNRRCYYVVILFCLFIAGIEAKKTPEPDMQLVLEDGREAVLHPDSTWGFVQFSFIQEDTADIYMDLDDGRIICLKLDNTWGFVKKKPPKKGVEFSRLPSINASASATMKTLDAAVRSARAKVFDRAATRLIQYARKSKMTKQYLIACIKDEVGEEGAEVSYKPGWTAKSNLQLSKVQVKKILDCVTVQVEAGTGTGKETK